MIALPLNVFYGAGVPACLLILNKNRPRSRRNKVLLVYAARHYRELSNSNQLRPQDIMRVLVHYHAYGDAKKAAKLVASHSKRLREVIKKEEAEEVARVTAEYQQDADKLVVLETETTALDDQIAKTTRKGDRAKLVTAKAKIEKVLLKPQKELAKRDERIAEARKRAEEEQQAIQTVGEELVALYGDESELAKHARVVEYAEIEENEFNLNIPRYVDTFEPEEPIDVNNALAELDKAEKDRSQSDRKLRRLLAEVGYAS